MQKRRNQSQMTTTDNQSMSLELSAQELSIIGIALAVYHRELGVHFAPGADLDKKQKDVLGLHGRIFNAELSCNPSILTQYTTKVNAHGN